MQRMLAIPVSFAAAKPVAQALSENVKSPQAFEIHVRWRKIDAASAKVAAIDPGRSPIDHRLRTVGIVALSPIGYTMVLALPALAWSHLTLQRHTRGEVALGTIIGAGAALGLHQL